MNFEIIKGNYIIIHQLNIFFNHVSLMLLEHFDTPKYSNTVFSVGTYIKISFKKLQEIFPNKRIIIYQLEQLMDLPTWQSVSEIVENIREANEIWDYDNLNVLYLKNYCGIKVNKIVPLLFTKSLEKNLIKDNPEFDVLFYGFLNQRRFNIFNQLQNELYGKIKLIWIYGTFDLDKHIANSKVILNLHAAEPWNRQEQVRMFYPIINGKTVISETSQLNNMPNEIIETNTDKLSSTFLDICNSDKWKTFGLEAKENFKIRTQNFLDKEI